MADQHGDSTTARREPLARRQTGSASPYRMLDRFADEVDRMFDQFGLGRGWHREDRSFESLTWSPRVDVTQRDNTLVIRADLPGLTKDDVKIDVADDVVTIHGERRHEHEEERGGVYRSERSYGSFYRTVPLPEGAIADQAKASFTNGVLEITMPAPPEQVRRGRRLEISDGGQTSK